jgi:hypothetical protein
MKTCTKCKVEKELIYFYKVSKNIDGFHRQCKVCVKEWVKNYREINKEKIKERSKKWYNNNKDYVYVYQRIYIENNKEKINNNLRKKRSEDNFLKFKHNVRSNICSCFRRGTIKHKKNTKTEKILCCTIEEFKIYIQSQFTKGMNWNNYGKWHLDHIIPIATAKTEEDVIRLNHYTNFQPLWAEDNLSKSDKIIEKQLVLL